MAEDLKFDSILPQQIKVDLGGKMYTLTAASAAVTNRFRSAVSKCFRQENGQTVVTDPGKAVEAHLELVSQCLKDQDGKVVPVSEVKEWPNPIVEAIIKSSVELCGLNREADETQLKN